MEKTMQQQVNEITAAVIEAGGKLKQSFGGADENLVLTTAERIVNLAVQTAAYRFPPLGTATGIAAMQEHNK